MITRIITTCDNSGQWIDLTTFSDYDEFSNYCCALHADEADPELMFQDYENFPSEMITFSFRGL